MLFSHLNRRTATLIRVAGLILVDWSILTAHNPPTDSGRGLVVAALCAVASAAWIAWTALPGTDRGVTPDIYVMAIAGGVLCGASPDSAASAFVFVAVVAAGLRIELARAAPVLGLGAVALAASVLAYGDDAIAILAYTLGFAAALLAGSNSRQSIVRADQAELLLAQTQRSHEEQLRAAKFEESTRIAREIHDVLAHALAGLTIQLEATTSLLENGADTGLVLARVQHAHLLAREGLRETRRAVGALRGDASPSAPAAIEALVAEYRASADAPATLTIEGDPARLDDSTGQTLVRIVQEALTNVRKHAPGADASVIIHVGCAPTEEIMLCVDNKPGRAGSSPPTEALAVSGGGYGLQGMRERAQLIGATLSAGATAEGWRVELHLPPQGMQ